MKSLKEQQIGCAVYYPIPLHLQKCFEYLGYTKGDLPEAELATEEVLSLPIYSELPADHQRRVVDGLCRAFDLGSSGTVRRIFPRPDEDSSRKAA